MNTKAIAAALALAIGFAWGSAVAQPAKTNVIYINGAQNTLVAARKTQSRIQEVLDSSPNHLGADRRSFDVDLVWNPIGWNRTEDGFDLSQDKKEVFLLKVAEEKFATDFRRIMAPFDKPSTIESNAAAEVTKFLDDMTPGTNFLEDFGLMNDLRMNATQNATRELVTRILQLNSAVVVAHSQGNLLANLAWAKIASLRGNDVQSMMRVVNVANTSEFSVNGLNFTHEGDALLFASARTSGASEFDLETLPIHAGWFRSTDNYCPGNKRCPFKLAPWTFLRPTTPIPDPSDTGDAVINRILQHSILDTYLSTARIPAVVPDTQRVPFTLNADRFVDRFEDFVYAAAKSLDVAVTSLVCEPTDVGQTMPCRAIGRNLPNGMVLTANGCTNVAESPGGTSTSRRFTCMPTATSNVSVSLAGPSGAPIYATVNPLVSQPPSPPTFTGEPPPTASVVEGGSTSFSVSATTAQIVALSYQWRLGALVLQDGPGPVCGNIAGARAATLNLSNVPLACNGSRFVVEVSGGPGLSATSREVTLTVTPRAPAVVPSVTSVLVNPASPVVGTQATFNVNGTNLQAGFTLSFPGCAATEVSSPSTTQRQFVCTLTQAGVNLAGSIRAASGAVLRSFTLSVAVSPAAPSQTSSITQVLDNVGASTGPLAQGATTDDTTPTLSGTLSAALTATQTLRVFNGSTILGTATVSGTTWSFTPTALANGNYSYTAAVASVDGIEGNRSAAWSLTISAASSGLVQKVSAGDHHTCALTTVGGVKCWGNNSAGALGDGTVGPFENRAIPVDVIGLGSGVAAISANGHRTCAVTSGGGVKCWGDNLGGVLGDGTTITRATPVDVIGLSSGVVAVSVGWFHTCVLTSAGGVKCWGGNLTGQLGDGTTTGRTTPVDVIGLSSGVAAISAGGLHTCALTIAGGVKCWGFDGAFGLLGTGGVGVPGFSATPLDVTGLGSGVTAISAAGANGADHTCALTSAGAVRCWGFNSFGQLGDGTTITRLTPVAVAGLISVVGITAAGSGSNAGAEPFTCALTGAGGAKCWGNNEFGKLGDGTTTTRLTPVDVVGASSGLVGISAGLSHVCAVTSAGGVRCWGQNLSGQLGDGTTQNRLTPVAVVGF